MTIRLSHQAHMSSIIHPSDRHLFDEAWRTARGHHGDVVTFYLPGMIRYGRHRGRYPAISITGTHCELQCDHCKGRLLQSMLKVTDPSGLVASCRKLAAKGAHGVLLSGGVDREGRLPWGEFGQAIQRVKETTGLFISAHVGFPDEPACGLLKKAGLDQALLDVMGDEWTAKHVYHLRSLDRVHHSLHCIAESGLELAPHIVAGLHYGRMAGEYRSLETIGRFSPPVLVIVVISPLKGTPMEHISPPSPVKVARLIATARLLLPQAHISLGCERPRNREGWLLERLALRAGVNRMAVWSEHALAEAVDLGLKPRFQSTCCSVGYKEEFAFCTQDKCAASALPFSSSTK